MTALATVAQVPGTRLVLAQARERIKLAARGRDREALRAVRDEMRGLAVHFLVHGGGPAYDVAVVAEDAVAALNRVVAFDVMHPPKPLGGPGSSFDCRDGKHDACGESGACRGCGCHDEPVTAGV
ncbi:hypothetical protein [Microbacterium rhizomatis]|uniref:Uncharacterized protein n=1 Tax=Microbacterium rhizomatis TaxID=1631477 RepID=A0A5J5J5H3_9MICO|nr:hypothetical protein [Microbacterium rhizomatis]KAA9110158.1 hypothetical protein F6B43_00140 [Microbacterium rhizomatis]